MWEDWQYFEIIIALTTLFVKHHITCKIFVFLPLLAKPCSSPPGEWWHCACFTGEAAEALMQLSAVGAILPGL
jgi:hypothetical protein